MRPKIKWSKILLALIFAALFGSLIVSDLILKKDFDRVDKSDVFWTFQEIFSAPYSHLRINGGNLTHLSFHSSGRPSVRVLKNWQSYQPGDVKTVVHDDTLFIDFPKSYKNLFDRDQLENQTSLRIFGPALRSVTVDNSNLLLEKFEGRDISLVLRGRSNVEVEALHSDLGKLEVDAADSSHTELELSPVVSGKREMHISSLNARLNGHSLLSTGHAQVDSLTLAINDVSGFECSGATWNSRAAR